MEALTRLLRVATRLGTHARSALCAALCSAACIALPAGGAAAAEGESLEYAVKAAYLSKFGIYVEWPATAFATPSSPLLLCVAGEDPFGATLDAAVGGQRIDGRPVVVRRLRTVGRDSGCHILYIGGAEAQRLSQIVEAVRGTSVLTVSDTRGDGMAPGIINFVVKDNRVRFHVDDEAAAQNGIAVSSKLLSLALSVKPRPSKGAR